MRWKLRWLVTVAATLTAISSATVQPNNPNFFIYNDSTTQPLTKNNEEVSEAYTNINTESNNNDRIKEYNNLKIDSGNFQNTDEPVTRHKKSVSVTDQARDYEEHTVITTYGPVQGHNRVGSEDIIEYLDIPYGNFTKFEEPTEPDEWKDIREIETHEIMCPQMQGGKYHGTENCLTLSVFATNSTELSGVLFYIHESDFRFGSGDPSKYGPEYLVRKGLVLVLPNYRLGPLGFLCLRNETAPGNAALKDLTLALKWTKDNIELFGGDPNNIVVSGDGASAALAGYLAMSPKSRTYIRKVITDSGSVLSHWAIDRDPITTATKLAEHINKTLEEGEETGISFGIHNIDDSLNEIDIETLIRVAGDFQLRPCIERNSYEAFLNDTPWQIVTKQFEETEINIDFLIGSTNHAGLKDAIKHNDSTLTDLSKNFESALPNDLAFKEESTKQKIVQKVKEHYFGTDDITLKDMKNISLYHTDVSYLGPDLRITRALVNAGATVFLYEFSFIGELNKELQSVSDDALHFGATKGDMVNYLFSRDDKELEEQVTDHVDKDLVGREDLVEPETEEEKMIDIMTELWVSFIKDGRPSAANIEWSSVNKTSASLATGEVWLSIADEVKSSSGFHPERLDLWTGIYREYFVDANIATKNQAVAYYAVLFFMLKLSNMI